MRFLVDGMLGGLARWLRILGQEVTYYPNAADDDLVRIASEEKMVILTRDRQLHQRALAKQISSALILGNTEVERLAQIARTFGLSLDVSMARSRCSECGSALKKTSKSEVSKEVPEASLRLYDQFWRCAGSECGKVYWIGSHWERMRRTLEEATKLANMRQ